MVVPVQIIEKFHTFPLMFQESTIYGCRYLINEIQMMLSTIIVQIPKLSQTINEENLLSERISGAKM